MNFVTCYELILHSECYFALKISENPFGSIRQLICCYFNPFDIENLLIQSIDDTSALLVYKIEDLKKNAVNLLIYVILIFPCSILHDENKTICAYIFNGVKAVFAEYK